MDIKTLKQITESAQSDLQVKQLEAQREAELKKENQKILDEAHVNVEFKRVILEAEMAARSGKQHCNIGKIFTHSQACDYRGNPDNPILNTNCTEGRQASMLIDRLRKYGFNVEFVFGHDGVGMSAWYNIQINW